MGATFMPRTMLAAELCACILSALSLDGDVM